MGWGGGGVWPDFAPADFFFFTKLKEKLAGCMGGGGICVNERVSIDLCSFDLQ